MDTLSHALWGKGLFGYRGNSKVAIFFGAMPDLFSFGLLFIIKLITGNRGEFGAPKLETIPDWLFLSYDIFHSFITAFLCIAIVFYYKKKYCFCYALMAISYPFRFPLSFKRIFPNKTFVPHL